MCNQIHQQYNRPIRTGSYIIMLNTYPSHVPENGRTIAVAAAAKKRKLYLMQL